jgi:hypothetical protein
VVVIPTRKEKWILGNIDLAPVALAGCGEVSRVVIGYDHAGSDCRFMVETKLEWGIRQEIVRGKGQERNAISRMKENDNLRGIRYSQCM